MGTEGSERRGAQAGGLLRPRGVTGGGVPGRRVRAGGSRLAGKRTASQLHWKREEAAGTPCRRPGHTRRQPGFRHSKSHSLGLSTALG